MDGLCCCPADSNTQGDTVKLPEARYPVADIAAGLGISIPYVYKMLGEMGWEKPQNDTRRYTRKEVNKILAHMEGKAGRSTRGTTLAESG